MAEFRDAGVGKHDTNARFVVERDFCVADVVYAPVITRNQINISFHRPCSSQSHPDDSEHCDCVLYTIRTAYGVNGTTTCVGRCSRATRSSVTVVPRVHPPGKPRAA